MKKALIIGGSGGLSGTLARRLGESYEVWAVTRGHAPLPEGIHPLTVDRNDEAAFRNTLLQANMKWDAVFDCICMNENHGKLDLEVLPKVSKRLVVISTDSVYDPTRKRTPQAEEGFFVKGEGRPSELDYAENKRKMEEVFLDYFEEASAQEFSVTIFRPGHIYGPGFLLGCYPQHSRQGDLPEHILAGKPLSLVACGIYLIHPIFVNDLADTMIDCVENPKTYNEVFCIGGPEAVENRLYYEIIGEILGKPITIQEIPLTGFLESNPGFAGHLNHRIYDLSKLRDTGVKMPSTTLYEGLKKHLNAIWDHGAI